MSYETFLESKRVSAEASGFDPVMPMTDALFPFQRDIVRWALRRGKAAIFADCGMGKTLMQIEWSRHVAAAAGGPVLILAPLAVANQTRQEGEKFGIDITVCANAEDVRQGVNITNYEKLHHFDLRVFRGVALDESSCLKAYTSKTRNMLVDGFLHTPYKSAWTATPAPNDYMELGNHSEFLGVMSRVEMLAMFFVHDGGETQKWRLKGHAEAKFWEWVASWAAVLKKPSDLGYPDAGFSLPSLEIRQHTVPAAAQEGKIVAMEAQTLEERRAARRGSLSDRVKLCADIANASPGPWIIWCDLNAESEALTKAIEGAVEVTGSDSDSFKEKTALDFANGKIRALVSKPSILGWGMNFQVSADMAFVGLSDSYEQFYQAVRRSWRFGQTRPVTAHVITSESEGAVVENIKRKEKDAERMTDEMVGYTRAILRQEIHQQAKRESMEYQRKVESSVHWEFHLGDCIEVSREIPDNSIHYSIFSPPFASLYTYSNSERDMGNCKDAAEFIEHFDFLLSDLYRMLIPGRLVSFHCMNLPTSKQNHGYIGIQDFRGDLIKAFQSKGFIYHSEVCIWKDPVTAMQRTKALGLLHKQIKKDSCMSRQGIPDYLVTMRKPGENPERVSHTAEEFPVDLWQRYASPVWFDINPSNTLQKQSARAEEDERHICPLQLEVIERALMLWTNPGDLVYSPFGGIASEGFQAVKMGRRFKGAELKESYWEQGVSNLRAAEAANQQDLFTVPAELAA